MARVPETEIERLKSEVSVERLVEASGIELKKAGKDLLGRRPFHDDDTASMVAPPAMRPPVAPTASAGCAASPTTAAPPPSATTCTAIS